MTNEEMERVMGLIAERQNRIAEQQQNAAELIAALARSQVEHGKRLKSLEESHQLLVQLVSNTDARLDRGDERNARLEEAFQTVADIAARQDERIRLLEGNA